MARHLAATHDGGRATFLLEVALDRARMKSRLAGVLNAERAKRGGGDARRFAQPEMARLLGYSLRQYQRLEDANDPSLPSWSDLERIMELLDLDATQIFGADPEQAASNGKPAGDERQLRELRDEIRRGFRDLNAKLDKALAQQRKTSTSTRR